MIVHLLERLCLIFYQQNTFKASFLPATWEGFMSEIVSPVVFQLGVGGVGGFVVGFALKKLSKLILVLIGVFIIALIYLATQGVINIDYAALWSGLANLIGLAGTAFSWIVGVISLLPFAASFIAGFLLGLKLG
jgi:uncharacterized membrane protein (Fun14 family)